MTDLVITIECADESDAEWLRHKCMAAVENEVEVARDENRLDGSVSVSWEMES